MNFNLSLRAEGEAEPTKYTRLEEGFEDLLLAFSSIQGSGYVRVYLKRLNLIQRLETISLFEDPVLTFTIYFTFEAGDEIGFAITQSGPETFSLNLNASSSGNTNTGNNNNGVISGEVLSRILAIESILKNSPALDPFLNQKLISIEQNFEGVNSAVATLKTDVATLSGNFNTFRQDSGNRIAGVENAINDLGAGGVITQEPFISVSLSSITGSTFFIDLAKRTDYVITLDASKQIQFSGESTLGYASVSFKNPANGTIYPISFGETINWYGGSKPVWNTTANQGDLALFRSFNGTSVVGAISQKNIVFG